jgi:hypothetical protein
MKSRLFKYKKIKNLGSTEIHSNKSNSSMRKTMTPLYMVRNGHDKCDKSKEKLATNANSKKKKYNKNEPKRPSSALGHIKHKNLRSKKPKRNKRNKSKHSKNNESLYMERYRSKENTLNKEDLVNKGKKGNCSTNLTRNNSKIYMKINGFDKIISSISKRSKSKEGLKKQSKADKSKLDHSMISGYTINTDQLKYSTGKSNMLGQQYVFLSKSKAPSISMSTRNLSLDKNDQSSILKMTGNEGTAHFLKNYSIVQKSSTVQSGHSEVVKIEDFKRNSLIRSKKQPSQKDL